MSPTRYPSLAHRKQTFKRAEAELNRGLREAKNPPAAMDPAPVIYADGLFPDIEGFVHGIIAVDPVFVIQCDGCGRVAVGELDRRGKRTTLVIQFAGINFGHDDPRRLCATCRIAAGWNDYDTQQCRADAKTLAHHEAYMRDGRPSTRLVQPNGAHGEAAQLLPPIGDRNATLSGWHAHLAADADARTRSPFWAGLAARLIVEVVPS